MTAVAEIRYVALKPLRLSTGAGRLRLVPGDEVPAESHGRWLTHAVEAGKVAEYPAAAAASLSTDELRAELEARGYKVAKAPARKAA